MQDRFKLKAWDKSEKRMLYRGLFDRNWYATESNDEHGSNCVRGIHPDDAYNLIVLQSTDRKDKNENLIYEGHILRSFHFIDRAGDTHYLHHRVIWSEKYSGWLCKPLGCSDSDDEIKSGTNQLWVYMSAAIDVQVDGSQFELEESLKNDN